MRAARIVRARGVASIVPALAGAASILPVLAGVALLLVGCTRTYAPYDQTAAGTLMGDCERAAYSDPAVEDMVAKLAGGANTAQQDWVQRVEDVKRQSVQRCMLQRGGGRGAGGVELPRRGVGGVAPAN